MPAVGLPSPLVTVYIPVYNGSAFLYEALDSIAAQSMVDWECLLIDDASTDQCLDIVECDARVRVLQQPVNMNVANASNVAIRAAHGKYLARLDQDDIAAPTRLAEQVDFLERHPEVDVCSGAMQLFGEASHVWSLPTTDAEIKANLIAALENIANPDSMSCGGIRS